MKCLKTTLSRSNKLQLFSKKPNELFRFKTVSWLNFGIKHVTGDTCLLHFSGKINMYHIEECFSTATQDQFSFQQMYGSELRCTFKYWEYCKTLLTGEYIFFIFYCIYVFYFLLTQLFKYIYFVVYFPCKNFPCVCKIFLFKKQCEVALLHSPIIETL